jgi:hypothetical protein
VCVGRQAGARSLFSQEEALALRCAILTLFGSQFVAGGRDDQRVGHEDLVFQQQVFWRPDT